MAKKRKVEVYRYAFRKGDRERAIKAAKRDAAEYLRESRKPKRAFLVTSAKYSKRRGEYIVRGYYGKRKMKR